MDRMKGKFAGISVGSPYGALVKTTRICAPPRTNVSPTEMPAGNVVVAKAASMAEAAADSEMKVVCDNIDMELCKGISTVVPLLE